jgi:hypothetical protein
MKNINACCAGRSVLFYQAKMVSGESIWVLTLFDFNGTAQVCASPWGEGLTWSSG